MVAGAWKALAKGSAMSSKLSLSRLLAAVVVAGLLLFARSTVAAPAALAYEAVLPAELASDPDLCKHVPCGSVIPGADRFSLRKGRPPYVEAFASEGDRERLVGYVFLSTDIVDIPAYSGKPIVTLIGMDTKGVITGVRVLKHSEPILLLGIPEEKLVAFVNQYLGKVVGSKIEVGKGHDSEEVIGLDAISGATVTVIAENQVIMRSAMIVARQVGIMKPPERPPVQYTDVPPLADWEAMRKEGAVQRLTVRSEDVGVAPVPGKPYIDIWFGYLNAPTIGKAVLGEQNYRRLMDELKPGEHAIFLIADGIESFKGSGFVRGGIFDRIQVAQELDTYTFRDLDYQNLYSVRVPGVPYYRESSIFIIRDAGFAPAYPWNLVFLANKLDKATGNREFVNFTREFWLPDRYLVGGRPHYERPLAAWEKVWRARALEIAAFALLLIAAGVVYALRDRLVRAATHKDKTPVSAPKYALWGFSIAFAGFYLMAQPSITQVLTWFHSVLFKWEWELFLSDPFIFLFWWFIIVTVFFWGRGMFCGWLCPYGALTEMSHKIAGYLGLKRFQRQLPAKVHDKLKWTKYWIFVGLLGVSFYSMSLAEVLAEIEPFKTTFLVGVWNRSWPFVVFWLVIFAACLIVERFFCKYLCPLGAALAIPSTFRWWGLKRKNECGPCTACQSGCESIAIDDGGRIDQRECMLCLDCMVLYYDEHACPPLAKERKQRTRAGQPLTAIAGNGYYIPLVQVPASPAKEDAFVPTAPIAAARAEGFLARVYGEIKDHLLPWNRQVFKQPLFLQAAGVALAVLVTWVWLLGAAGKLGPGVILGWWLAWSAYEVITRMSCKPFVKDGPWWDNNFRPASWADMVAYVGFKNLLIGAGFMLFLKGVGALAFLHGIPELRWLY